MIAATTWQLLFVDDDPDICRQVQEYLEGEIITSPDDRLQVETLNDFGSALNDLEVRRFDLLILDVHLGPYSSMSDEEIGITTLQDIQQRRFVPVVFYTGLANPGCYPAASLLAFLPLVRSGAVRTEGIIIDAKSGVSGAGRGGGGGFGFSEVNENVQAYSVPHHNHIAEIEQELSRLATVQVVFTPHLIPMTRGILATVYARMAHDINAEEALRLYDEAYSDAPFVRVLHDVFPQTKATLGSNYCDVTVKIDPRTRTAIAIAAIDNLGRGAAGQAIQNMNLMFHLPETTGLCFPGVFP